MAWLCIQQQESFVSPAGKLLPLFEATMAVICIRQLQADNSDDTSSNIFVQETYLVTSSMHYIGDKSKVQ